MYTMMKMSDDEGMHVPKQAKQEKRLSTSMLQSFTLFYTYALLALLCVPLPINKAGGF